MFVFRLDLVKKSNPSKLHTIARKLKAAAVLNNYCLYNGTSNLFVLIWLLGKK